MNEKEYSVSEAVRLVGVESHVLRYWEEELQADIRRTSQGHRVYSEKNIETFRKVKELKETGLQLRAIRILLDKAEGDEAKAALAEQICEIGSWQGPGSESQRPEETGRIEKKAESMNIGDDEKDIAVEGQSEPAGTQPDMECSKPDGGGEIVDNSQRECGNRGVLTDVPEIVRNENAEHVYGVTFPELSSQGSDNLQQFENILKRLIGEVVEERNRKMEEELREVFREELERMYLQYGDLMAEAAASSESYPEKTGIISQLRRLFGGGR